MVATVERRSTSFQLYAGATFDLGYDQAIEYALNRTGLVDSGTTEWASVPALLVRGYNPLTTSAVPCVNALLCKRLCSKRRC